MKKTYIQPTAENINLSVESQLLANSGNPGIVRQEELDGTEALSGHAGWNSSDWSEE